MLFKIRDHISWLFGSAKGLMVVAVAWDVIIVAFLSLFSGPVRS